MTSQIEEDITQEESVGELLERLEKERRAREASARAAKELLTRSAEEVIEIDSQDPQGKVVVEPPNPGPFGEPVPPDVTVDEAKNPTVTPTGASAEDLEKLKLAAHRLRGLKAAETRKRRETERVAAPTAAAAPFDPNPDHGYPTAQPDQGQSPKQDFFAAIVGIHRERERLREEYDKARAALLKEYEDARNSCDAALVALGGSPTDSFGCSLASEPTPPSPRY